ncbi:hypothetical protein G9C98_001044 [Cotesia typhae]|uniref:Uncharacterized protein n=1 Tax=Cotesia typhae TaxID=2053667 RepID=A0A8J5R020_9HYME|nr:hypothetical protein G9C98_001044 [Cotesia typhae]
MFGSKSTGPGRDRPDPADVSVGVAGFHKDVPVLGEFRASRSDHPGSCRQSDCPGADGSRDHPRRAPEEDNEQCDRPESPDVRHLPGLSRLILQSETNI